MKKTIPSFITFVFAASLALIGMGSNAQGADSMPPSPTLAKLQAQIDQLTADNKTLNEKISTQETKINSLSGAVSNFGSQLNSINGRISSLTSTVGSYGSQFSTFNNRVDGLTNQVSTLNNQLNGRLNSLSNELNRISPVVNGLAEQVRTLFTNTSNMAKQIKDINTRLNATGSVTELTARVKAFETFMKKTDATLLDHSSQLKGLNADIKEAKVQVAAILTQIKGLGGSSDVDSRLNKLEAFVKETSPQVDTIAAQVKDLTVRVKALESSGGTSSATTGQITELTTRLNDLSAGFTKMKTDLADLAKVPAIAKIISAITELANHMKVVDDDLKAIHAKIDGGKPPK